MAESPFSPLRRIGEGIYFFRPQQHTREIDADPTANPTLITLCTWLGGATNQRILKYISRYRVLFPYSAILLITARMLEISVLPFRALRTRLAAARKIIRSTVNQSGNGDTRNCLLHLFSHGGCNTAIQLALSLQMDPSHPPLELGRYLGGIIFDCCPGDDSFWRVYEAAAHSLPRSRLAQMVGRKLLFPAVGVINGLQQTGWMSSVRDLRAQLNDSAIFGKNVPRLYMYSITDPTVESGQIESHIEEAKSKWSYTVYTMPFPDSPHCALARDHPHLYWAEIEKFWKMRKIDKPSVSIDLAAPDKIRSRL
ncbi:hypothetical protein POX_c03847 [Penicillium oxalicum]|uniref:hypothetical protein n=1 Tax=Penicillium oxalicum TaxID=69781 RepID=UPI0020B8DA75|nr:hypothetical protein POX_c03847 [Penicillium oxalicum]KAI2790993.1 hypothetical protein POX_c03847 [Penicillium oxalicum]